MLFLHFSILPCLLPLSLPFTLTLPSAKMNTIKYVFEEKFLPNNFREFSLRGATCEISQLQTSVGGHHSVQFKLKYAAFNAYFVKMYSEHVKMFVTLYLCMCIFLWLWLFVCVCLWRGGHAYVCPCWCNDCNMNFRIIHHIPLKTPHGAQKKTIYTTETPCTPSPLCILTWCGLTGKLSAM